MNADTTDYRDTVLTVAARYARIGEYWETNLFAGGPDHCDRAGALKIADWLDTEADAAWGADYRHGLIAAEIRAAIAKVETTHEIAIYAEQCAMSGRRCGDPEHHYGDRARETDDLIWYSGTADELLAVAAALDSMGQWAWRAARAIREYLD